MDGVKEQYGGDGKISYQSVFDMKEY